MLWTWETLIGVETAVNLETYMSAGCFLSVRSFENAANGRYLLLLGGNEAADVLEWLSSAPYDDRHNEVKRHRIKGTGMWLLETLHYKRWRFEDDAPGFLWCHGGPGTGKTVLAYGKLFP